MACTFYLLPSRAETVRSFAGYLEKLFPGLAWTAAADSALADLLAELVENRPDAFVVYREDLPADEEMAQHLADVYGADEGDLIVELPDALADAASHWSWRMGPVEVTETDDDVSDLPAAA